MKQVSFFSLLLFIIALSSCNQEEVWKKQAIIEGVAEVNTSGSGYRDLEGKFIDYEYNDFGRFQLAIYDNSIKWSGYNGYFKSITAQVAPQISKITEGIYFLSWIFDNGGGDNVVVNFNVRKVFAHLRHSNASPNVAYDFEMIDGKVICGPSIDCNFPNEKMTSFFSTIRLLNANAEAFDLPQMGTADRPLIVEHIAARDELKGKAIQYTTKLGRTVVQINGDITRVTDETGKVKEYRTHATKIGAGIYYLSWLDNQNYGNHIVFNLNTMQAFDHLTGADKHHEKIYTISCFGTSAKCL